MHVISFNNPVMLQNIIIKLEFPFHNLSAQRFVTLIMHIWNLVAPMLSTYLYIYSTVRKLSLELKFCYFANGRFAYLNPAYYYVFRTLSMIAYIIEIQKSKFSNI